MMLIVAVMHLKKYPQVQSKARIREAIVLTQMGMSPKNHRNRRSPAKNSLRNRNNKLRKSRRFTLIHQQGFKETLPSLNTILKSKTSLSSPMEMTRQTNLLIKSKLNRQT
jgi:hypothetical protein